MNKLISILFFFLFTFSLIHGQENRDNLRIDLQSTLDQIVETSSVPGMTLAIIFDDEHKINLASGYNDIETKTILQPESRMLAGSVGKMFVSAIVLKLIEQNKLGIKEKASTYLNKYKWYNKLPNFEEITIENLLNHTSGLPRYIFQPEFLEDISNAPLKDRSPVECLSFVFNKNAVHHAGKGWAYSDTNYLLLGLIIENISGKSYYDLLQKEILTSMDLSSTEPSIKRNLDGLAQGYIGTQNYFNLPEKVVEKGLLALNPAFEWTGGGVITNVLDLAKFAKKLHEGDFLNDKSKDLLCQSINMTTGQSFHQGYGLGSFVWCKSNDVRYGHSGFFPGYLSHVEYSSSRQYAIAIQINTDQGYPMLQQYIYQLEKVLTKYMNGIDEAKIHNNFKTQESCWNAHDIECYMNAYAKKEPIQTASRGGVTFGYDNIIGDYKKYFPKDKMGNLHFDNFNYRRLNDNLYFVTGRFNLKFPDREELSRGWFSVVSKKIDGEWYLITDHSS